MKKITAIGALILFAFSSCQKLELTDHQTNSTEIAGRDVNINTISGEACSTVCIDPEAPIYYYQSYPTRTATWGSTRNPQSKSIATRAWNTLSSFVVELTFTLPQTNGAQTTTVDVTAFGQTKRATLVRGVAQEVSFNLPAGWAACNAAAWSYTEVSGLQHGPQIIIESGSYNLIGECIACEESFNYVLNTDGSYTFSYVPAEDVSGAELIFTFAQGSTVSGLEGFVRNGFGNAQTWSAVKDLESCETYNFTVTLAPNCSGQGSAQSNVWTDFKVNNVSKKGTLSNITMPCNR